MTSVFDVAADITERAGGSIEALKLQKLCFYSFGWHAHLTAQPLFPETFYALRLGPVVGELLHAHSGQRQVDGSTISAHRKTADEPPQALDEYTKDVLGAVWKAYGSASSSQLVRLTHTESAWSDAWKSRGASQRGELPHADLISYFLAREPRPDEGLELPPPAVFRVSPTALVQLEKQEGPHLRFADAVRAYGSAL
ncbi:Panacea domain-containing protein [Arthrobacter sp. UM1]|uniref:Panacea domain-containing protein n=1 Tax=Arthrobacter sp. UM1 TaxID=2766776 RepID=UPI001CF6F218|nr:type II toxin-antitoxin system antitoxin SocA domain-containing protein [Arthrobacter sp. UM1]MCB4208997.1 DUF4065 domain-containing protein [Arthrobacter sp. UM1]